MRADLAHEFTEAMYENYRYLVREHGYRADEFLHRVTMDGGVRTAETLLSLPEPPGGFQRLRERGLLACSMEAHVLRPRYAPLFSDAQRAIARRRLESHGFDVDAFLHDHH